MAVGWSGGAIPVLFLVVISSHALPWPPRSVFDRKWADESFLGDCNDLPVSERQSAMANTTSASDLIKLYHGMGVTALNDTERACFLGGAVPNSNQTTAQLFPFTIKDLNSCLTLMAPPWSTSPEGMRLATYGLMNSTTSMCAPGAPCKMFNQFLVNGSLKQLCHSCGCSGKLEKLILNHRFIITAVEAKLAQSSDTGKTAQCFVNLGNGKSYHGALKALVISPNCFHVAGPMYRPIFYANAILGYLSEVQALSSGCQAVATDAAHPTAHTLNAFNKVWRTHNDFLFSNV